MGTTEVLAIHERGSIVDRARRHAAERPHDLAFCWLAAGDETGRLTFGELHDAACAVAAGLDRAGARGERVLLLMDQGLEPILAFLGCLYAGAVAVPCQPPRMRRHADRIRAVVEDSAARFVLSDERTRRRPMSDLASALGRRRWLSTEQLGACAAEPFLPTACGGRELAFLQYTSGSTSRPKGVRVTHGNVVHNQARMAAALGHHEGTVMVSWLPLFHDMGLIGMLLAAIYNGVPCYLMSPLEFVAQPRSWLEAISRYRATCSGAPDFAYRLCAERFLVDPRQDLDLSCWQTAFSGAEPVRADTLDRFAARFAPYGFSAEAFFPCYGLAEATLFASGGLDRRAPQRYFDQAALEQGRAQPATEGRAAVALVSCGQGDEVGRLRIVDPRTRQPLPDESVGEIWLASASVTAGYWRPTVEGATAFAACLADGQGDELYLRTGDLGFVSDGRLFVIGRLDNVVIVRGRNFYPHDVESVVEGCHGALRPAAVAAFGVDGPDGEQLAVAAELRRPGTPGAGDAAVAIRAAVGRDVGVELAAVVLLPPAALPRTTSGKIRHLELRRAFAAGELDRYVSGGRQPNARHSGTVRLAGRLTKEAAA